MSDNKFDKLEAKRTHLQNWLEQNKQAQRILPYVQKNLEMTDWEIDAINNLPEGAQAVPQNLEEHYEKEYNHILKVLPSIPKYDQAAMGSTLSVATSGTNTLYAYVAHLGESEAPKLKAYSDKYTKRYQEIQIAQERPTAVRDLLTKLNSEQLLQRFDRASNAYSLAKSGSGERTAAAAEMRTLLDGLQGELFKKARKQPRENMTWTEMAKRMTKGEYGGIEHQELLQQDVNRGSLVSQLSTVLKDRDSRSTILLDNLWSQLLDHIFVVIGLLKLPEDSGKDDWSIAST